DLQQIAIVRSNLAAVELRLGRPSVALEHAQKSVSLGERIGADADLPDMMRQLADALEAVGPRTEALEGAEKAVERASVGGARLYLADATATLERIRSATGD